MLCSSHLVRHQQFQLLQNSNTHTCPTAIHTIGTENYYWKLLICSHQCRSGESRSGIYMLAALMQPRLAAAVISTYRSDITCRCIQSSSPRGVLKQQDRKSTRMQVCPTNNTIHASPLSSPSLAENDLPRCSVRNSRHAALVFTSTPQAIATPSFPGCLTRYNLELTHYQ